MSRLSVEIPDEHMEGLRSYAARVHRDVDELIRDYVEYLVEGGLALALPDDDGPSNEELARMAMAGGAFDWLKDEPDLYTFEDGEPV